MSDTRDLLIEIGTEELPPKALRRLSHWHLPMSMAKGLDSASLQPEKFMSTHATATGTFAQGIAGCARTIVKQLAVVLQSLRCFRR